MIITYKKTKLGYKISHSYVPLYLSLLLHYFDALCHLWGPFLVFTLDEIESFWEVSPSVGCLLFK